MWLERLTTQAQRPGARDATIATATLSPGSLQRMVELSRCAAWRGEGLFIAAGGVVVRRGQDGCMGTGLARGKWFGGGVAGRGRAGSGSMKTPPAFGHPSLQQYDEHLALRSVSQRTREEYGRFLRVLARHAGRDPAALTEAEARAYLLYLKEQKHYAPGSMRIAAAALRMFYNAMLQRGWRLFDLVRSPDRQKLPTVLTREQVAKLLGVLTQPRFRVLLTLIYACGLRLGEALKLEVRDIQAAQRRIHIREGKGGKDRFVPLSDSLLKMLRAFWATHRHPRLIFPGVSHAWRERGTRGPRRMDAPMSAPNGRHAT